MFVLFVYYYGVLFLCDADSILCVVVWCWFLRVYVCMYVCRCVGVCARVTCVMCIDVHLCPFWR